MSAEPFLSRWSKRKRAVQTAEPPLDGTGALPPEPATPEAAPQASADQSVKEPVALSDVDLSPEEIAALPSLEDLTAETDISVFLRRGVPEPLRKAALRRMWVLDPKIRDFVCEAREYAYDWNTPEGVPGYGPLPSTEEIARMAARIVGGGSADSEIADGSAAGHASSSQGGEQPSFPDPAVGDLRDVPSLNPAAVPNEVSSFGSADQAGSTSCLPKETATMSNSDATQPSHGDGGVSPTVRRHGGAMPV